MIVHDCFNKGQLQTLPSGLHQSWTHMTKKQAQIKAVNYMEKLSIRQISGLARGDLGKTSRILSVNVHTEM